MMSQTEQKGLSLEGIKLGKERVFLDIDLFSFKLLTIYVEGIMLCCHHIYEVGRGLEVSFHQLWKFFADELHLNSVGLPNFEDMTPTCSIFLDDFFYGFTPHAVGYRDAFFVI